MAKKLKPTRKHVNMIMKWCIETYGTSKYNKYIPEVQYRKPDHLREDSMADYDDVDHVIFLNKNANPDLYELANSLIHEYTHYKQNLKHYDILSLYLPYHKNPLEIEANKIANRDAKKCIKELFGIQNKRKK